MGLAVWLRSPTNAGNLRLVSRMRHAFSSCTVVTELDLTGFDPSSLTDLFYAFAGCSALTTIYVDADWTLPSGCTGNQCFYSCKSLVGGNGTARVSGKTGMAYCVGGGPPNPVCLADDRIGAAR